MEFSSLFHIKPGDGTAVCNGVVELAAKQPSWELVDFHLDFSHFVDCYIILLVKVNLNSNWIFYLERISRS